MRVRWLAAVAGCAALAACASVPPGQAGTPAAVTVAASPVSSGQVSGAPGPEAACRSGQGRGARAGSLPAGLTGVQFVSPRQGWAVGSDRILATSDGGAHWRVQDRGRLGLTSLDFVTAPWDLLTRSGAVITGRGNVGGLTEAAGASFLTPQLGWVIGADHLPGRSRLVQRQRIVRTSDGGHSWQNEYTYRP